MIDALLFALLETPVTGPRQHCPIDRAVYTLRGATSFTAGFARQDRRKVHPSDLVFWLKTPERLYVFSFQSPNGYGGTYLAPDVDPRLAVGMTDAEERDAHARATSGDELSIPFDAFTSGLEEHFEMPPQSSDRAPAFIFARALGPALWYEPVRLSGNDPAAKPESMPIGMFAMSGCDRPPPPQRP